MNHVKIIFILFAGLALFSCNKKSVPKKTETATAAPAVVKPVAKKPAAKPLPPPKMIIVDDKVAKKTADGRMYYDFQGKRYWKNFKDGKYYQFSRNMYSDPDFKPRK